MDVPPDILKCVVFLCDKKGEGKDEKYIPRGTGFLVGVPSVADENRIHLYVVTALHNLEKADLDNLSIRINGKEGGRMDLVLQGARWYVHPQDGDVDVAILPFSGIPVEHGHNHIPLNMFLSPEHIKTGKVEVGHDAFIVGLFTQHHGKFANLPILRAGNISMLPSPEEKIAVKWHEAEIDGYLIEARSIGGLSGSPVFFEQPLFGRNNETKALTLRKEIQIYLAGLIHGHFQVDSSKTDESTQDGDAELQKLNMGIAIVIPAHKILEALMQDELLESRKSIDEKIAEQKASEKAEPVISVE